MKNKKPFVNVIILNLNNFEDTKECVESLKKIEYNRWGITLVDNGSTDDSLEKLKKEYSKNKKIRFILNESNLGFAKANNLAMKEDLFKSEYFLLLNNDTIVDKKFLTNLMKEKKKLIAPTVYNYYSRKEFSKKDFPGKFNFILGGGKRVIPKNQKIEKVDYASGSCWLIEKELFKKTKGFNEKYFAYNEEIEWAYRLKKLGYQFYISRSSKIWHKGARTSKKLSELKLELLNRNIIWFEREYAKILQKIIFFFYFFIYKFPKRLFLNILEGDFRKKTKCLLKGVKEGFFKNFPI